MFQKDQSRIQGEKILNGLSQTSNANTGASIVSSSQQSNNQSISYRANQCTSQQESWSEKYQQYTLGQSNGDQAPRKSKQAKKQQVQQEIITPSNMKQKEFRVFYGIIGTQDDMASPFHQQKKDSEENKCEAQINSNNHKINQSEASIQDSTEAITEPNNSFFAEIKKWFENLSIDERVNALTTTSPYLSEILGHMSNQIQKKGPTLFAQQLSSSASTSTSTQQFQKQAQTESSLMGFHHHYSQGYSPLYFLGGANPESYQWNYLSQYQQQNDMLFQRPKRFEEGFYCRVQHKSEIDQIIQNDTFKYMAQQKLETNVRFCDVFSYLDTITVSYDMIDNPTNFFNTLSYISGGQVFQNSCQFQFDAKIGLHIIDTPNWFKPERFHSFAQWIAAIYEQTLCANFINWYVKSTKRDLNSNIQYLFEVKEMQDHFSQSPIINLHSLAFSWLNLAPTQRDKFYDKLKSMVSCESDSKLQKRSSEENKVFISQQKDFFFVEQAAIQTKQQESLVSDEDLNEIIALSKESSSVKQKQKKTKKPRQQCDFEMNAQHPKYFQAVDFITYLLQSSLDRISQGKDFVCRTFLKLIQQMHQEQVIQELLGGNSSDDLLSETPALNQKNGGSLTKNKKKKKKQNKIAQEEAQAQAEVGLQEQPVKDGSSEQITSQDTNKPLKIEDIERSPQIKQKQQKIPKINQFEQIDKDINGDNLIINKTQSQKKNKQGINMNHLELQNSSLRVQLINQAKQELDQSEEEQHQDEDQKVESPKNCDQTDDTMANQLQNNVTSKSIQSNASPIQIQKATPKKLIDSDMKKISNEYVSDMLDKIQTNQAEVEVEFEDITTRKSKKKKKSKKDVEPTTILVAEPEVDPTPELVVQTEQEQKQAKKKKPKQESVQTFQATPIITKEKKKALEIPSDLNIKQNQSKPLSQADQKSRPPSTEGGNNGTGGRRRRKKGKAALDPSEAMNQFIKGLSKKDEQSRKSSQNYKASPFVQDKFRYQEIDASNTGKKSQSGVQFQQKKKSDMQYKKEGNPISGNGSFYQSRNSVATKPSGNMYQEKVQPPRFEQPRGSQVLSNDQQKGSSFSKKKALALEKPHEITKFTENTKKEDIKPPADLNEVIDKIYNTKGINTQSPSFQPSSKSDYHSEQEEQDNNTFESYPSYQAQQQNYYEDQNQIPPYYSKNASYENQEYEQNQDYYQSNQGQYSYMIAAEDQKAATIVNISDQLLDGGQFSQMQHQDKQTKHQVYMPKQVYNAQQTSTGKGDSSKDLHHGIQNIIDHAKSNGEQPRNGNDFTGGQQNNFMIPPNQFGQMQGHIGQNNQQTNYNINQFGNMNIGSMNNNYDQMPGSNFQFPNMMNMQNFQNAPNFGTFPQFPKPQYPQQYFDYNLPQNIEYKFYEKFDNDIYDEVNKIQTQLDTTKEERNFILEKLQAMCEEVFKNEEPQQENSPHKSANSQGSSQKHVPRIKQFGSLVTGLALESSDMDMAVTNLILPDREKMIENLDLFAANLQKWEMIQDMNAISTATIPVIKAIVDLNQLRQVEMSKISPKLPCNKGDFGQTQSLIQDRKKPLQEVKQIIPEELAKLKIDITFDDNLNQSEEDEDVYVDQYSIVTSGLENKNHLGLASCKLIKNYVENYKCLKEVSIILKQFLAKVGLNQPYHGGLSSYSTVILLVAYMNKWNLKMSATLTPARLLMGFLDYYSYYFNVSLFGIDVSNNGSFFEHSSPETNFVILDPLNYQNNTTKNSFLTHEIIKSFRKAFNSLKNLLLQYQQMQQPNITDNLLDVILERNQDTQSQEQEQEQEQEQPEPQQHSPQQIQGQGGGSDSMKSSNGTPQNISQGSQGRSDKNQRDHAGSGELSSGEQPIQIQIQQIQQIQIIQQLQQQ